MASGMRSKPYRKGDRLTVFLKCEVIIFFVFIFFVETALLIVLTAFQFRHGTWKHPYEALWNSGLTSAARGSSWI